MPDYSKTKIYLIKSPNIETVYVGETVQELKKRFSDHKSDLKLNKKDCTSKIIIAAGDAYIELYENFPCNSKSESCKREKQVIKLIGIDKCVNKCKYSDKKEYCAANKDKKKEYDARNRDKRRARYAAKKLLLVA